MKIKTFQFKVSDWQGNNCFASYEQSADPSTFTTETEIDQKVNDWISNNVETLHDLKATPYSIRRHNSGRADTVILVYTLTYEPKTAFTAKAKRK